MSDLYTDRLFVDAFVFADVVDNADIRLRVRYDRHLLQPFSEMLIIVHLDIVDVRLYVVFLGVMDVLDVLDVMNVLDVMDIRKDITKDTYKTSKTSMTSKTSVTRCSPRWV